MEDVFRILEAVNYQPQLSQKKIAEVCELSAGKVNYLINDLIQNGYLYSEKSGKSMRYYLTEKGISFLEEGLEAFQMKKIRLQQKKALPVKQAVVLAAGNRKEFMQPAGLLTVDGQTLLDRTLHILLQHDLEDIIIVTGYAKEAFAAYEAHPNLRFIENPKYKWTGSMASLACAQELISGDFLLIEDDILIEEHAIELLVQNEQRDCILITTESGSGDEAFVELRGSSIYKISKDIHQFNQVDGEMVGVSKISYDVYQKMLQEFAGNRNPYMHYEYMLFDIARHYDIGYLKLPDLVWAEVDTLEHYDIVVNKVYPRLKRKEAEFKELQIKGYAAEALQIRPEEIASIEPFGGMTNKNFKVRAHEKEYVLRVPGNGTEQMINRHDEKANAMLASRLGIDTNILYFNEETGIKVAELIPNAETVNAKTAAREDYMQLTTSLLRTLHESNVEMSNTFDVFAKIAEYEQLLAEVNGQNFADYEVVKAQVMQLKHMYQQLDICLTPCHNDTVPENFVKSGPDTMYLIDWEYGGMNDPMWDIAAHSLECGFSPEEEELFLCHYLGRPAQPEDTARVLMNKIFQDFLWSIWTNVKEAKGDDFGTYGIDRYNRAKENLRTFF